ncbi:MAG: site-2 protease family protein [Clostridia bacterium]|nr:site-2 protease family protein [Clostridia bacterium]
MYIYELLTENGTIDREGLLNVVAFIFALFVALILHEIAHGLAALWCGDNTAKRMGRLSLNPVKHFDLMGLLMMLLVGFGWAKPVPINPYNFKKRRFGCIAVSVAGVLTNFLLAFLFVLPYVAIANALPTMNIELYSSKYYILYLLIRICSYTASINISFGLFNILFLYPLDGYRLLSCFVSENNGFMRFIRRYSFYIMIGLILIGNISFLAPYSPLDWYIGTVGGSMLNAFQKFWGLFW